ncbi:MAG: VOC family protein [Rhodocyclaceae bacterium]|nr:VOC family protein [Rhodocyclaceae bacterium]
MSMDIEGLDHLVLTVADIEASCRFYCAVLGFEDVRFGNGRRALAFGAHKINLHRKGHEFEPKAAAPTPGSADLCFISRRPIAEILAHLAALGIAVEEGPVERTGARSRLLSLYFRDPDGNLIEVANRIA